MKFKCTKEISCTMGGNNVALSFDTLSTREADKIQQFVQYGYHIYVFWKDGQIKKDFTTFALGCIIVP